MLIIYLVPVLKQNGYVAINTTMSKYDIFTKFGIKFSQKV